MKSIGMNESLNESLNHSMMNCVVESYMIGQLVLVTLPHFGVT